MERRYKAFISYRHLPLDLSIARKLHRRIERYIVPEQLRKNGEKHLGLVFRDQDELPISSDLSNSIRTALDNSEFLIVICTPDTQKSRWVMEEIDYFLSTHDRDHILAVLVSGEPDESFPPQLTRADDGTDKMRSIEPLAANIVAESSLKRDSLFRTESLRILAALLGCPYDALYRREQRYRRRRITAAVSAVLLTAAFFIGMLLNRNAKIKANYEQSLINQSGYLASESIRLLSSGDRLTAIRLAMEALPGEDNERPLVSRAVSALVRATGIYESSSGSTGAVGTLPNDGVVTEYILNDSGSLLAARSDNDTFTMWDTFSMKPLWNCKLEDIGLRSRQLTGFCGNDRFIMFRQNDITCRDPRSGEELWTLTVSELDPDNSATSIRNAHILSGGRTLAAFTDRMCCFIDPSSGSITGRLPGGECEIEGIKYREYLYDSLMTSDGSRLLTRLTRDNMYGYTSFCVTDTATGDILFKTEENPPELSTPKMTLLEDLGIFTVAYWKESPSSSMTIGDISILTHNQNLLCAFDLATGEKLWTYECDYVLTGIMEQVVSAYRSDGTPVIAYAYSNKIDILNPGTGELINSTESRSRIVCLESTDKAIFGISDSGDLIQIEPDHPERWYSEKIFVDELRTGDVSVSAVWVQQLMSGDIIKYEKLGPDPLWSETSVKWLSSSGPSSFSYKDILTKDGVTAISGYNEDADCYSVLVSSDIPGEGFTEIALPTYLDDEVLNCLTVDIKGDVLVCFWTGLERYGTLYFNCRDLSYSYSIYEDLGEIMDISYLGDGDFLCVFSSETDGGTPGLSLVTIGENRKADLIADLGPLSQDEEFSLVCDKKRYAYIAFANSRRCIRADLSKKKISDIDCPFSDSILKLMKDGRSVTSAVRFSQDGERIMVQTSDTGVSVFDGKGELLCSVTSGSELKISRITPDGRYLVTVDTADMMTRYSTQDGSFLNRVQLNSSRSNLYSDSSLIQFQDDMALIRLGGVMNFVSVYDWGLLYSIDNCVAYCPEQQLLISCRSSSQGFQTGCFVRYSTDMLLRRASELLGDWQPSDAQKSMYGISD